MRSFASIATFATLAFATVCSALPTAVYSNGVVARHEHDVAARGGPPHTYVPAHYRDTRGDDHKSPLDIIVQVTADVKPLCAELTATISADIDVNVAVTASVKILGEIKDILLKAVVDIKASINLNVNLLALGGVTVTVGVVAKLLAELIVVVVTLLGLVVKVCASVDITVLLNLCIDISVQLSVIVSLVVGICADVIVVLVPLLSVVLDICINLKLTALLGVLAIL